MLRYFSVLLISSFSICLSGKVKNDSSYFNQKAVFIEFFGSSGYVYNLTYDQIIKENGMNKITASLGAQFFPKLGLLEKDLVSFSPQFNYLHGNKHNLELGIGVTFNLFYSQWGMPVRIGYRYQSLESGLFFRAGFTPIITNSFPEPGSDMTFHNWGGIGIGYTF